MQFLIKLINSFNNAIILKKNKIVITKYNTLSLRILNLFQKLNIIESFNIYLNNCFIYLNSEYKFSKILMVSKPNRYIYYTINDLIKLRSIDLFNEYIVSINDKKDTIVTIDDAIYLHKGGLLLLKIIKM